MKKSVPAVPSTPVPRPWATPAGSSGAVAAVETASLSLAAIIAKFPEHLKSMVLQMPGPEITVALPVPTILKQLASGSVKMSLASLHRQAPGGVFSPLRMEDKQMVQVPMPEVLRCVSPAVLRRREDQRKYVVPEGFNLFGNTSNPYELAPVAPAEEEAAEPASAPVATLVMPAAVAPPAPAAASVVAPARAVAPARVAAPVRAPVQAPVPAPASIPAKAPFPARAPVPASSPAAAPASAVAAAKVLAPPADMVRPVSAAAVTVEASPAAKASAPLAAGPGSDNTPLVLKMADISGQWPEAIRAEIAASGDATVAIPAAEIAAGLAKGKVAFTWGALRSWLNPPPTVPDAIPEDTELALPLRVVAPAYLKLSKLQGSQPRKRFQLDESIPALFASGTIPPAVPTLPEEPVADESLTPPQSEATIPLPAPALPTPNPALAAPEAAAPLDLAPPVEEPHPDQPISLPADPPAETEGAPKPAAARIEIALDTPPEPPRPARARVFIPFTAERAAPPARGEAAAATKGLGELFGQPDKSNWSPAEIVQQLVQRPDVDGAVVALKEGLVVAHELPEGMRGEVFAAFLPQIFARLNQYAGEMKLGEIDDLVLSTRGAHLQLFRLGIVYFAVLGKPGETLPWPELRMIADYLGEARNH